MEDLCACDSGIQTGPFGSQLHQKDYVSVGTPIITVEHLGENRIIHQDLIPVFQITIGNDYPNTLFAKGI